MMWLTIIATLTASAALLTALGTLWQIRLTSRDPSPKQFARIAAASERAADAIEAYAVTFKSQEEDNSVSGERDAKL